MKKGMALLLALLLAVSLTACGIRQENVAGRTEKQTSLAGEKAPDKKKSGGKRKYAVKYHIKINPEFDVYADEELNVLWVEAVNEDAEVLLADLDVTGLPVTEAFGVITEEAKKEGFLSEEKGNTVQISIDEVEEKSLSVCPVCSGAGTLVCWDCEGKAKLPCGGCTDGIAVCGHCGGAGAFDCDCEDGSLFCEDCGGSGWMVCDQCGGSGRLANTCAECGGTGKCRDCGGAGYVIVTAGDTGNVVYKADGTPETGGCEGCHGTGICQVCSNNPFCPACCEHLGPDGVLRNPGGIPGKARCTHCDGNGAAVCPYCEGVGSTVCEDCAGAGSYPCPECGGNGFYPCGCELNGYRWCPCCWGSGIDGTGMENYDYSLSPRQNMGG